jgi:hypothetical protein
MKRILMVVAALALIVSAGLAGGSILERNRYVREMELLRASLRQARFSVDSCRMALTYQEQSFRLFDEMVDSLRREVRGFEDPAQGGVPEAMYPEYLEAFDAYNDSVANWQLRADSLQTAEAICRALVESHNALSDSLRRRVEARRSRR